MQRLIKEEAGIALPLAVMMVVIVGVMGAGLLVFVTTDLGAVIEGNQGQKALNLADAGVQAGKSHLLQSNALYLSYDGTTNASASPPNNESSWSCGTWDATSKMCGAAGKNISNLGDSGESLKVWIQYLKPATTNAQANDSTGVFAPEVTASGQSNYPPGKDYFKVVSESTSGKAKRKVEAIYNTSSLGVPQAYYTPGSIRLDGNSGSVNNISLFAGGNITGRADFVRGVDLAYEDWNIAPNTTARTATSCTTMVNGTTVTGPCAGKGALGTVENRVAGRDYDSTTCPKFVAALSDPSGCAASPKTMTFPFRVATPDIQALKYAAQSQRNGLGGDNYYEVSGSTNVKLAASGISTPVWPVENGSNTVVFVKFSSSGSLTWNVGSDCNAEPVRGTVVVVGGSFSTSPTTIPLRGTVVVDGNAPPNLVYDDTGNTCMQSFVIASGNIKISGNIGSASQERGLRVGTYSLNLVSWRELYQ